MTEIAIVVPIYNVEPYLPRCIESLLSQTFADFEIVLVDDGSPDGCATLCDEYAAKDSRVRVLHKPNGGVSSARNAGLDRAIADGAKFVTFVDPDDWVDDCYLSCLREGMSDDVDVSALGSERANGSEAAGDVSWRIYEPRTYWGLETTNQATCWAKLFRIGLFDGIRYPVGQINEDELTNYRILFRARKIAYGGNRHYHYFFREESIMHAPWSEARLARLDAWRHQIDFFSKADFPELVAKARRALIADCVDAVAHLRHDDARSLVCTALRREIAAQLTVLQAPRDEYRLAYKTAHPVKSRLLKLLGRF